MERITIKLLGTASWVPDVRISSQELMRILNTGKSDDWVDRKLGIKERAIALNLPDLVPRTNDAPSCAIVSEKVCHQLFSETNTDPEEIEHLILVTCTPDELHFKFTTTELHRRLSLRRSCRIHEIPSGCAGLVEAMDTAKAYLHGVLPVGSKTLIVAVNLTSPFFVDWRRYVDQKEWLSAVIFADGACALLLQSQKNSDVKDEGLFITFFEVDGSHPLMRYSAGGALNPTTLENVRHHLFSMNAKEVEEHYRAAMVRNFEYLAELCPEFDVQKCKRIYLHQASPVAVKAFQVIAGLPESHVPLAGDHLGNPAAAITGIMFDQDRRAGIVQSGDLVLFSVVGAGAINGVALLRT